jgi:adenylylsulfate kinase
MPERARILSPQVIWLTGVSGSGKTTIANRLTCMLNDQRIQTCLIDGDRFRDFWNNEAGYTKSDRIQNQKNLIYSAALAKQCCEVVVVASLSPYRTLRDAAREKLVNFHEVYVKCSAEALKRRDPKELYKRLRDGNITNMVLDEDYETPSRPELVIDTELLTIDESATLLLNYVLELTERAEPLAA